MTPGKDVTLRPELAALAYEYAITAPDRGFIGMDIFPIFEVPLKAAQYPYIPIESLIKTPEDISRAPRAAYKRSDYKFEMNDYSCKDRGWEEPVDDEEAKMYARFFDAETIATYRAVDVILRNQEIRAAKKLMNTAAFAFGPNAAMAQFDQSKANTQWNDYKGATPRADIIAARQKMKFASGQLPNALVISDTTLLNLLLTQEIRDAFKYTNPIELGGMQAQASVLAQYFGLDKVLVGGAIRDTAKKGAVKSLSNIWSDDLAALVKLSSGGMDLREPCIGRTFLWIEDSATTIVTEQYRDEEIRSNVYRVRQNLDEAFVFTGACELITDIKK